MQFVAKSSQDFKEGKTSTRKTIKDLMKDIGTEDQKSELVRRSPKKDLVGREQK